MRALFLALGLTLLVACGGGSDARFAMPERTVQTLLAAYGVEGLSEEQVRTQLTAGSRFELRDHETFARCFTRMEGPGDEGLGGFVFGALAAGKDHLTTEIVGDTATVSPREGVSIVLRNLHGEWRIDLDASVPEEVRRRLTSLAIESEQSARRGVPTQTNLP